MKILLTGCEGLIGSALRSALKNNNVEVQGYDNKLPNNHPDSGNILDITRLSSSATGCNGVIHLAAVSRVIWGERDPDLCWTTNVEGTSNVLNCALDSPASPWVIYASSREVYGDQDKLPVIENTPLKPVNIYGRSKAAAEEAVNQARTKGINTAIVRFSNVYGSTTDHPDRVIPAFCRAAAIGQPLKVEGSKNTFDFTHVTDVVEGVLKIIEKLTQSHQNLPPLHFTAGRATSLREAARIAVLAGGNKSQIIEAPSRNFDVSHFYGDASQTMDILDWQPKMALEEGMQQLVSQFTAEMNEQVNMNTQRIGGYHNEDTQSDSRLSPSL